jgi:hypothetical protein
MEVAMHRTDRLVVSLALVASISIGLLGAEPWTAPSLANVEQALDGLAFDAFIDASFRLYSCASPRP